MSETGKAAGAILSAALFAAGKHGSQRRKGADASPYINHPLAVADLLARVGGVEETDILVAALLHDTLEDTGATSDEIRGLFGESATSMVQELTDDKSLDRETRKRLQVESAPHKSRGAKLVKLADKICNVRDVTCSPPDGWPAERRRGYLDWSERVVAGLRGVNRPLEELFDRFLREGRDSLDREAEAR